jgi:tetratricopeptide (TPR) repeat protein
MILAWLNGREAAEMGTALADNFAPRAEPAVTRGSAQSNDPGAMAQLLRRVDSEVRPLQLNFYQKAKFANSFKWRLIENGISREVANDLTHSLVLHLSQSQASTASQGSVSAPANPQDRTEAQKLFHRGNKSLAQGDYAQATALYEEALELDSSLAGALNNLGSSLSYLGRYEEAEQRFRQAMTINPTFSDPYANLGVLLRQKSYLQDSETLLRRALKLKPNDLDARTNLGLTLVFLGRHRDARACFAKVLKSAPRNVHALFGMGQIATVEGRFEEAETTFKRAIEINPKMTNAWAALANIRKMTTADSGWLESMEKIVSSAIHPLEEANLRFAMGKYCDDVGDFPRAFQHFKRGNELLKAVAEDYDRKEISRHVDAMIRVYSRESLSTIGAAASSSERPVFVIGMPRSGTSLAEQIIASHPAACGAGELPYWANLVAKDDELTRTMLSEPARRKAAEEYLRILEGPAGSASRIVDKAPVNSDFLGLIYSVFPKARVIYMQRDPVDTCLSCYFQQFLTGINFAFDLSDLVHYYCEHQRIMAHWRAVLPQGFIIEVPYEELVTDQETWSRKMIDFIGLEWDARCLEFHTNRRQVTTASTWQVRQKIYKSSVARWRNYEKFIGPLKALAK